MQYIYWALLIICSYGESKKELIKGKLVYKSCANAIVEIQNPKFFYLAQKEWQRSYIDSTYKNVFAVTNNCYFDTKNISIGETFYFNVISPQLNNECIQCTLFEQSPSAKHFIEVVKD